MTPITHSIHSKHFSKNLFINLNHIQGFSQYYLELSISSICFRGPWIRPITRMYLEVVTNQKILGQLFGRSMH